MLIDLSCRIEYFVSPTGNRREAIAAGLKAGIELVLWKVFELLTFERHLTLITDYGNSGVAFL